MRDLTHAQKEEVLTTRKPPVQIEGRRTLPLARLQRM